MAPDIPLPIGLGFEGIAARCGVVVRGIRKAGPLLFDRCADPAAREQGPRRGLCGCFDSQVDFGARVMAVAAAALTDRLHWRFARLRSLFALFGEGRKGNFHVGISLKGWRD